MVAMDEVQEELPWAEEWQREYSDLPEPGWHGGGGDGVVLHLNEGEEQKLPVAEADDDMDVDSVWYYTAFGGQLVKVQEQKDGKLVRKAFVEGEEQFVLSKADLRVWEFDFGRNTAIPEIEKEVKEKPLEADEVEDNKERMKEKMKKELSRSGEKFLDRMKKKVAAEKLVRKKQGRFQKLVKETVAKTKKGSGKNRGEGPKMWWKKGRYTPNNKKKEPWAGGVWGLPEPPAVPAGNPGGQSSGSRDGGGWKNDGGRKNDEKWKKDEGWKKDGGGTIEAGWKKDRGGKNDAGWKKDEKEKKDEKWKTDGGWKNKDGGGKNDGGWKKDGGGKNDGGWKNDGGGKNDGWKKDGGWKNDGWTKDGGGGWGGGWNNDGRNKNDGWKSDGGGGWGGGWGGGAGVMGAVKSDGKGGFYLPHGKGYIDPYGVVHAWLDGRLWGEFQNHITHVELPNWIILMSLDVFHHVYLCSDHGSIQSDGCVFPSP